MEKILFLYVFMSIVPMGRILIQVCLIEVKAIAFYLKQNPLIAATLESQGFIPTSSNV